VTSYGSVWRAVHGAGISFKKTYGAPRSQGVSTR
jgi:transposase